MANENEQVGVGQIAKAHQRIIYVEPNDVYDKDAGGVQQGLSLTPKYEDFCVSFNLIIESFSRFRTSGSAGSTNNENGESKTYSIQWGLTAEDMVKRRASVLQGDRGPFTIDDKGNYHYDVDNYNFLTTYFTDITFDSYKEKTQIEGLGVESVQISYESWYTPTVVIKFVDVRGSALFGREEAIHVDEKLTAENIFGAFFTMPYPLFRLQVKGFLGKPVTYQLTCSSFKGEFNSQTGNFEAVATFIGYSWSLLTDIPFAYLVAAPYATYIGYDYWERHKNTPEWGLWNDGDTTLPPPKLYQMFENIKKAQAKTSDVNSAASAEQNEELQKIEGERKLLNNISNNLSSFVKNITNDVDNNYLVAFDETEKKEQLLLFYESNNLTPNVNETRKKYDDLYASVQEYERGGYTSSDITTNKVPNKWNACPVNISFLDKFVLDTNGKVTSVDGKTQITQEKLKTVVFNDNYKLTDKLAEILLNTINEGNTKIKKYVYLIDLFNVDKLVKDRLQELKNAESSIIDAINDNININIINIISSDDKGTDGFKPFIGNVFKIIFCHIETFCHIMFDSFKEIYEQSNNGERDASYLGISGIETDIVDGSVGYVTPWPAIINQGSKSDDCGYVDAEKSNIYGWVGDIKEHRFIEEKVVYALQEGIQHIVNQNKNESSDIKYNAFPISPSDFTINYNPFTSSLVNNPSELSGHLATRIASNIGVTCGYNISDNLAKLLGRLDAYNLYSTVMSISQFSSITKDIDEDLLKGIMFCKQEEKYNNYAIKDREDDETVRHHTFEIVKKIEDKFNNKGRHPQFTNLNDSNFYCHFYDKNYINYVPSTLKEFKNYKAESITSVNGDFVYNTDNENLPHFIPNVYEKTDGVIQSSDWLHTCDSSKVYILADNLENYVNRYMFNIVTDDKMVSTILNKKSELESGNPKIYNYEVNDDLSEYVETFIKVGNKYKANFFKNVSYMLSGNVQKLGLDTKCFLPSAIYGGNPSKLNYNEWYEKVNGEFKNHVSINENCEFKLNDENADLNNLVIQQFKIDYYGNECNLFGCPFYYLQNLKKTNDEDNVTFNKRSLLVKALLFLHTFKYDYNNVVLNVFSNNKKNGAVEEVPKGYLLFLGAMLWRKRWHKKYNQDPIIWNNSIDYFKPCSIDKTLFNDNNIISVYKKDSNKNYNFEIKKLFGGLTEIDYNIENQLISLFENFATTTFNKIASKYELKNKIQGITSSYTCKTFKDDVKVIYKYLTNEGKTISYYNTNDNQQKTFVSTPENFMVWLRNQGFYGWDGNYSIITVISNIEADEQGLKLLFSEDSEYQSLFKDLYFNSYIVSDSCYRRMGKNTQITSGDTIYVKDSTITSYLSGFVSACKDIVDRGTVSVGNDNMNVSKDTYENRDLSVAIYYYLKNLWDKWLVISKEDAFDVSKFFDKNFIFTDSFYINTYHLLAINCEKLLSAWTELADNGSVFNFLSRIVNDHGCIFLPVPDYVGFNGETQKHDIEMMEDLFRPLPYNSMEAPSNSNKFVVMYTHSPSKTYCNDNGFKVDNYDIWSHTEGVGKLTPIAEKLFKSTNDPDFDRERGIATREGYNVPSFGISFGRQNNHIFKNLKVTMENPVMTEQAIKAQWGIALKGANQSHSICFIGQDTFNVFSNYSYSVNVEMMGNAQICPLMYFQLMNIPMWRGTYMIYKVTHNMTPGNMITTLTAMKMSKYAQPYNSSFFTRLKFWGDDTNDNGLTSDCESNEISNSGGIIPNISGGKITNPPQINIKNKNAYNLVLLRYAKAKKNPRDGHIPYEGVIYEYDTNEVLTWTIEDEQDVLPKSHLRASSDPIRINPGGNVWPSSPAYHVGCSTYCAKLAGGRGGFGAASKPKSMLTVGSSGCLFHPGANTHKWTEGCVLCGTKAVNGERSLNIREFYADKIFTSTDENVKYWRNFYDHVVPQICNGKEVHLYKVEKFGSSFDFKQGKTNNTPNGGLVDIKTELEKEGLADRVIINPLYATTNNFGGRVMPGYVSGQNYLWYGKKSMKKLIKSVKYMKEKYPNNKLMIWDAYRPYAAADEFLTIYKQKHGATSCDGKTQVEGKFIARVTNGSHSKSGHCVGKAIDLTVTNSNGTPLNMTGSTNYKCSWAKTSYGFDEFSSLANKNSNNANQKILQDIMKNGGFNITGTNSEYWHFDSGENEGIDGSKNYS